MFQRNWHLLHNKQGYKGNWWLKLQNNKIILSYSTALFDDYDSCCNLCSILKWTSQYCSAIVYSLQQAFHSNAMTHPSNRNILLNKTDIVLGSRTDYSFSVMCPIIKTKLHYGLSGWYMQRTGIHFYFTGVVSVALLDRFSKVEARNYIMCRCICTTYTECYFISIVTI